MGSTSHCWWNTNAASTASLQSGHKHCQMVLPPEWSEGQSRNCGVGNGAQAELANKTNKDVDECKDYCDATAGCNCITTRKEVNEDKCYLREDCDFNSCEKLSHKASVEQCRYSVTQANCDPVCLALVGRDTLLVWKTPLYESFEEGGLLRSCDRSTAAIVCENSQYVTVTAAVYGRPSADTYICGGKQVSMACSVDVTAKIQHACNDRTICAVEVCPSEFGEDPCGDHISKYLEVEYTCNDHMPEKCDSCADIAAKYRRSQKTWDAATEHTKTCWDVNDCTGAAITEPVSVIKEEFVFSGHDMRFLDAPEDGIDYSQLAELDCQWIRSGLYGPRKVYGEMKFNPPDRGTDGELQCPPGSSVTWPYLLNTAGEPTSEEIPLCSNCSASTDFANKAIANNCPGQAIIQCTTHPSDKCESIIDRRTFTSARLQQGSTVTILLPERKEVTSVLVFFPPTAALPGQANPNDAIFFQLECQTAQGQWEQVLNTLGEVHSASLASKWHRWELSTPCSENSTTWRLSSVSAARGDTRNYVNAWGVLLEGASHGYADTVGPTSPCGMQMTISDGVIHTTWAQASAGCTEKVASDSLAAECVGTTRDLYHLPLSSTCSQILDSNPSTITAFDAKLNPSIKFIQLASAAERRALTHLFVFKSAILKLSRQLQTFVVRCGSSWSQSVTLSDQSSWAAIEEGWVAVPFNSACSEEVISLNKVASHGSHLYIPELAFGTSADAIEHLPMPKSRKIYSGGEGYCVRHQTFGGFDDKLSLRGNDYDRKVASFVPDIGDVSCASTIQMQFEVGNVGLSIRFDVFDPHAGYNPGRGTWGGCATVTALTFGVRDQAGNEVLPAVNVQGACDMVPGCNREGKCDKYPGEFLEPKILSSQFNTLNSALASSGKPLQLVGGTNFNSNIIFQKYEWSLQGSLSASYWIKVPAEDDCPL